MTIALKYEPSKNILFGRGAQGHVNEHALLTGLKTGAFPNAWRIGKITISRTNFNSLSVA